MSGDDVYLTYSRGDGSDPIAFGLDEPYILLGVQGLSSTLSTPATVKTPGQAGERAFDSIVGARTVALQVQITSETVAEHWIHREALARTFAAEPLRDPTASVVMGELRLHRGDAVDLSLPALPRNAPADVNITPVVSRFDIELFAPDPYWRELVEQTVTLEEGGGFEFPLEHAFEMPTLNASAEVTNAGQVAAPILIRFYGELTAPKLENTTTGEAIEFSTFVDAGEFLEVSTEGGNKYAELDVAGVRTNKMADLNLAIADFLWLPPGVSTLAFSAGANVSGRCIVTWRQRYAGV